MFHLKIGSRDGIVTSFNTPSNFATWLQEPIKLGKPYEVGISTITYTPYPLVNRFIKNTAEGNITVTFPRTDSA